jgi:hypothetical protein
MFSLGGQSLQKASPPEIVIKANGNSNQAIMAMSTLHRLTSIVKFIASSSSNPNLYKNRKPLNANQNQLYKICSGKCPP